MKHPHVWVDDFRNFPFLWDMFLRSHGGGRSYGKVAPLFSSHGKPPSPETNFLERFIVAKKKSLKSRGILEKGPMVGMVQYLQNGPLWHPTTHLVGPPMRRSPVFCISHLATWRDPRWFQKRRLFDWLGSEVRGKAKMMHAFKRIITNCLVVDS